MTDKVTRMEQVQNLTKALQAAESNQLAAIEEAKQKTQEPIDSFRQQMTELLLDDFIRYCNWRRGVFSNAPRGFREGVLGLYPDMEPANFVFSGEGNYGSYIFSDAVGMFPDVSVPIQYFADPDAAIRGETMTQRNN